MKTKTIDHPRIIRVVCDIVSVGTGAICLSGVFWFTEASGNQIALLLLTLCGAVAGTLVGWTEHRIARRIAILLTTTMSFLHLYIQFVIWQQGGTSDYAEPVALVAAPVILLIVAQAVDWFWRRGYRRIESKKSEKLWVRRCQPLLRLLSAFLAAYRWLALGLFLVHGPAGTKSQVWGFVVGCLIQLGLAVLHTAALWLFTEKTEAISTHQARHEKSSVPHVAKPSL